MQIPPLTAERIRDFWAKVKRGTQDECWPWTAGTLNSGYGVFGLGGKAVQATHVSLTLDGRPRPPAPNNHALHGDRCTDRLCVNPSHLRWGSNVENISDKVRLGRQSRGEMLHRSTLTEADIRAIRASTQSQSQLAATYGVNGSVICQIKNRNIWRHVA